ncbi:hypothetical protein NW762_006316 [Fusarium torreyae]|uniref:Transcription factor domain-containing protein n=1 Tax=Fusarium torreyae TaxID=1237075 RepID=A0A9W8VF33_9HYPO|nr:hypothetical protein NW762_006316 [Fusarium torreyae]
MFRAEGSADDLVTLAAINIFSLSCFFHGNDQLAKELLNSGRQMGKRLGLYGLPLDHPTALAFRQLPDDSIRMAAHVAWSTFNWLTIHVLYYHDESIALPPALPIPGDDRRGGSIECTWPEHPLPEYMGHSFTKLCEFFTIVQEVAVVYNATDGVPILHRVPLAFAEAKYQKVLAWADSLDKDMAWDQNSNEHVMLFQEAKKLMAEVSGQGQHHELSQVGISTTLIVDYDLAMTNRDEAAVKAVAQKFEEVALFDEFAVYK